MVLNKSMAYTWYTMPVHIYGIYIQVEYWFIWLYCFITAKNNVDTAFMTQNWQKQITAKAGVPPGGITYPAKIIFHFLMRKCM